jgi:hypothetical protein
VQLPSPTLASPLVQGYVNSFGICQPNGKQCLKAGFY